MGFIDQLYIYADQYIVNFRLTRNTPMKTGILKSLLICLLLAFVVQGCGREYYYYQQHKSHSSKYLKRQVKYKKYHHHDNGVDIRIRH